MQFFGHRKATSGEVEPVAVVASPPVREADLNAAYERGRRFERSRRHRRPIVGLAISVVALAGAGIIGLAAMQGSFTSGGQVIDRQLSVATGQAEVASRDAATATGEAVRDASHNLRNRAADRIG